MTDDIQLTLEILYSCYARQCTARRRRLTVPARDADSDGGKWVEIVRSLVCEDHTHVAPHCRCVKFNLMIPYKGRDYLGQATKH